MKHAPLRRTYARSELLLSRALDSIPLGSQTFSKSYLQFPRGSSPLFIKRGFGAHVWDVDDNKYIDLVNSLAAITLGYCDTDVDKAVVRQMASGVSFSLSHELEIEVAELITQFVPCADQVRFGKNGSDATAGAVRLARAYTGRNIIAACGYHGWQDWYIGSTTRNLGVPSAVTDLTKLWTYNDLGSLKRLFATYPNEIAAVIMEPMNVETPAEGFLESVKALTDKNGALLIFDETITGFRFSSGGAQELFGVIPDLATFGKGIANGFPLSAIAGRREIMNMMEEIFFSFTFGGETLSLAAAKATLEKLERDQVIQRLYQTGTIVMDGISRIIKSENMENILSIGGNPTWSFVHFKNYEGYTANEIKTFYLQEMFDRGILTLGTNNISFSMTDIDVDTILSAYQEVVPLIKRVITKKNLLESLRSPLLQPVFSVR